MFAARLLAACTLATCMLAAALLPAAGCDRTPGSALGGDDSTTLPRPPQRPNLAIGYIHHGEVDGDGAPMVVETEAGAVIEIEALYLTTSAIEIHACEPGFDSVLGRLGRFVVGEAHAHVPSSATRLGVPYLEDLLGPPGRARMVGGIAPPVGRYCRMYVILSPADDDVLNLTRASMDEIEGYTLLMQGRWRQADSAPSDSLQSDSLQSDSPQWTPFTLTSRTRQAHEVELVSLPSGVAPLDLPTNHAHALVLVDKTVSPALFDGLDPLALEDEQTAEVIIERLTRTFRMYVPDDDAP